MKKIYIALLLCFGLLPVLLFSYSCKSGKDIILKTKSYRMELNTQGRITAMKAVPNAGNYLLKSTPSYLISLLTDTLIMYPESIAFSSEDSLLTAIFKTGVEIRVKTACNDAYISFEVVSVTNETPVDALIWGPFYTTIVESIGETVGIVQNDQFTIGLQALDVKTLGGYPWNDNDHMPQLDIFRQSDYNNMVRDEDNPWVLYSVEAAKPFETGSSLQAYTRNRNNDRIISNMGHDNFVAPAYNDGGIVGSKIALFGCLSEKTLSTISTIELNEGLPHPEINGQWVKNSPLINSSYLIMDFSEKTIDQCLEYAKESGFGYLYHGHPFSTWGHFQLIPEQFPNGRAGLRKCVEKAEKEGIRIGTHFLTNFITTNDMYVTPVPDHRLAVVGSSRLVYSIDNKQTEIEIEDPEFFNQFDNNNLHGVRIGDEIIRYGSVSGNTPWRLEDCERGAFGTKAAGHAAGDTIGKLLDHAYKVFLGNTALNREIAENIADFMNETGVRMIDFDGLEGTHSTGMGNYAEALFAQQWYDRLNEDIKDHFLLGASRSGHYFWHIYSRMNWGEPWYAGFRESQTEYRLRNQAYYKRNLMPGMLGWFKMTPYTSVEDIAWLMARSAGYDAGFAFVTDLETLKKNANTKEIFSVLNNWETARLAGVFPEELKEKMRDISTEYKLQKGDNNSLRLTEIFSYTFNHEKKTRQPGEPLHSDFSFENRGTEQPLNLIVSSPDSDISGITIEINNHKTIIIPSTVHQGHTLKMDGSDQVNMYTSQWQRIDVITVKDMPLILPEGANTITFNCVFENASENASAKVEIRLKGETTELGF